MILVHKSKVRIPVMRPFNEDSWDWFYRSCSRVTEITWQDFMLASPSETDAELQWARGRPCSLYKHDGLQISQIDEHMENAEILEKLRRVSPFAGALTMFELNNLYDYIRLWPGP